MREEYPVKYEVLRQLALAGAAGEELKQTVEKSLRQTAEIVGLQAAAMYLWDDEMNINIAVTHAEDEASRQRLDSLEQDLFSSLRKEKKLISAYMSFGGETPLHSFTQPLRHGDKVFGALIGLQEGARTLVSEDMFLEALTAAIALNVVAGNEELLARTGQDIIDKERLEAIIEVAVTVNHNVNNPLTAILGNVQLLLLDQEGMDETLKNRLKTIETSALKIKDVTQKLLRLSSARSVTYTEGTSMIDLSVDDEESNDNEEE